MPHLVEIAFKGNRKEFFLWDADEAPPLGAAAIVEADRGEDLGRVHAVGELARLRLAGCTHGIQGGEPTSRALRLASGDDVRRAAELRESDESTRQRAMERVRANGLVMKLTDAEWQWDRKKLTFYFTAEKRVDFRQLVRDLAAMFRSRIELKQIGVRDEAKRLDGIGRCGRQYCSASWLPELRPVNLGVAKDQRLSLNPSQISGSCGRLMCCLRYEHEFYVQSRKRFPKEGRILATAIGEEKVVANDIFRERVTLRNIEGEIRLVPLADLRREMEGGGVAVDLAEPHLEPRDAGDDAEQAEPAEHGEHGEHGDRHEHGERPASRGRQPLPTIDRARAERAARMERGERSGERKVAERTGESRDPRNRPGGPDAGAPREHAEGPRPERRPGDRGPRRDAAARAFEPPGAPLPDEPTREPVLPPDAASPLLEAVDAAMDPSVGEAAGAGTGRDAEGERRRRRRGRRGGRRGRGGERTGAGDAGEGTSEGEFAGGADAGSDGDAGGPAADSSGSGTPPASE